MSIEVNLISAKEAILKLQKKVNIGNVYEKVQPILKEEVIKAFVLEETPWGEKWERSKASIEREAKGQNPKTLQTDKQILYKDMQNNKNYFIDGNSIKIKTEAVSKKGFYYGAFHNDRNIIKRNTKNWNFANISKVGINQIKRVLENGL